MTTPDPEPSTTTGLDAGGGVEPGETPPGEASTVGATQQQTPPGPGLGRAALIGVIILVIMIAGFLIGRVVSLW